MTIIILEIRDQNDDFMESTDPIHFHLLPRIGEEITYLNKHLVVTGVEHFIKDDPAVHSVCVRCRATQS